jgi:signal transduction histidine kinase
MLSMILNNLLSNAIKFTPNAGKISISAVAQQDGYIEVCIADSGIGIPPENIPKLFIISQSSSTEGTNGENGTGLGLLLCKEFVERNKGKIWAESKLHEGSKFYFTVKSIPG